MWREGVGGGGGEEGDVERERGRGTVPVVHQHVDPVVAGIDVV